MWYDCFFCDQLCSILLIPSSMSLLKFVLFVGLVMWQDAAILICWRILIVAWTEQCIKTALYALRWIFAIQNCHKNRFPQSDHLYYSRNCVDKSPLTNFRFCYSIYSSRRKLSACSIVDTRFICNACTRWELTSSKPPMSTPDRYLADAFPDRGHSQLIRCQPADFFRFSCPVCLRSSCDMSGMWQKLDQEVQLPPLPIMVFVLY